MSCKCFYCIRCGKKKQFYLFDPSASLSFTCSECILKPSEVSLSEEEINEILNELKQIRILKNFLENKLDVRIEQLQKKLIDHK